MELGSKMAGVMGFLLNFDVAGWFVVVLSVLISWAVIRMNVADHPNSRSSHTQPTPKGGGLAFVLPLFLAYAVVSISEPFAFFAFFPAFVVAFMGFMDDRKEIPWHIRFLVQLAMALAAAYCVVFYLEGQGPLWHPPEWLLFVLGTGWILCSTNIFNFMDGIDGLAGTQGALTAVVMLWVGLGLHSFLLYIFNYYLLFGLLGFLVFNFPRARLFMGDVGSQFLGFLFGLFGLLIAMLDWHHWYVMPLLLFNFIFDSGVTLVMRWAKGKNIFQAHREHLYQRLTQCGWPHWAVSLLNLGFVFMSIALIMVNEAIWQLKGLESLLLFVLPVLVQGLYLAFVAKKARNFKAPVVK